MAQLSLIQLCKWMHAECPILPRKRDTLFAQVQMAARGMHVVKSRSQRPPLPLPTAAAAHCGTLKASAAFWKPKPEAEDVCICRWDWEEMKVSANAVSGLGGGQQASRMGIAEVKHSTEVLLTPARSLDSGSSYDRSGSCLFSHRRI